MVSFYLAINALGIVAASFFAFSKKKIQRNIYVHEFNN